MEKKQTNKQMGRNDGSTTQTEKRNLSRRPGATGRNPGVGVETTDFLAFRFKGWGQVWMKEQRFSGLGKKYMSQRSLLQTEKAPPGIIVHVWKDTLGRGVFREQLCRIVSDIVILKISKAKSRHLRGQ